MRPPAEIAQVLRFGVVGLLNTALGYGVILGGLALGLGDFPANLFGYVAGLLLGFGLNARWTFARRGEASGGTVTMCAGAGRRYVLAFLLAYGANLVVLVLARKAGLTENPFVHLAGIGVYSCLFYLASSRFVFVMAEPTARWADHRPVGTSR